MVDGTADHETSSYPSSQHSVSKLIDSFSTSGLVSQDTDLLADSEPMETQSATPTSLLCSDSLPIGGVQLERICLNEEQHFPELAFVLGYTVGRSKTIAVQYILYCPATRAIYLILPCNQGNI